MQILFKSSKSALSAPLFWLFVFEVSQGRTCTGALAHNKRSVINVSFFWHKISFWERIWHLPKHYVRSNKDRITILNYKYKSSTNGTSSSLFMRRKKGMEMPRKRTKGCNCLIITHSHVFTFNCIGKIAKQNNINASNEKCCQWEENRSANMRQGVYHLVMVWSSSADWFHQTWLLCLAWYILKIEN